MQVVVLAASTAVVAPLLIVVWWWNARPAVAAVGQQQLQQQEEGRLIVKAAVDSVRDRRWLIRWFWELRPKRELFENDVRMYVISKFIITTNGRSVVGWWLTAFACMMESKKRGKVSIHWRGDVCMYVCIWMERAMALSYECLHNLRGMNKSRRPPKEIKGQEMNE